MQQDILNRTQWSSWYLFHVNVQNRVKKVKMNAFKWISFMLFGNLKIAQIRNRKGLKFWASATKIGAILVASACWKLAKSIFFRTTNENNWEAVQKFPTWVEMMHKNEFMAADFLILRVAKKSSISKFFKIREFFCIGKTLATETSNLPRHLRWHLLYADARECVKT